MFRREELNANGGKKERLRKKNILSKKWRERKRKEAKGELEKNKFV